MVEAAVRFACGRWWRTMTATDAVEAQLSLDRFCSTIADARLRSPGALVEPPSDGSRPRWPSVADLAATEPLLVLPGLPYPATVEVTAPVGDNATVAFRGNRYSVPPGLRGVEMTLRHRLGTATVAVHSPAGAVLVTHRLAPAGSGAVVRSAEHRNALEAVVLSAFSSANPCERKGNYPPGHAARAEAAKLLAGLGPEVVVDLSAYAALIDTPRTAAATEVGA